MRKKIIIPLFIVLFLAAVTVFILAAVKLDLLVRPASIEPPTLTQAQMQEDFQYFTRLIRDYYPFVKAIEGEKGLDNFFDLKDDYRERVAACRGNREFIALIGEMVQRLEQGTAHCDILPPGEKKRGLALWSDCGVYNISKKGYLLQNYWWKQLDRNSRWTHAVLPTVYRDGRYTVSDPLRVDEQTLRADSVILTVNGLPVDRYVQTLQHKIWLRFDIHQKKVYSHHSPFLVDPDPSTPAWKVNLEDPEGNPVSVALEKKKGYQPPPGLTRPEDNLTCIELDERTGYIRINVFTMRRDRQPDREKIDAFFQRSGGKYDRLIIDLRGNPGGAPVYWHKLLVERLITRPRRHTQYSMVTRRAWEKLRFHNRLLALKYRQAIDYGRREKVPFDQWPHPFPGYLDPGDFCLLKNTITYRPRDPLPFDGQIWLLVDHDTFSAAEDFAKAAKEMDFATLAGASTIGGAAVSFAPWVFQLPHSHILLGAEIEMAFNRDGTINEIYGTTPDHLLQTSDYPTEMPRAWDRESLLADRWIRFVMSDEGRGKRDRRE